MEVNFGSSILIMAFIVAVNGFFAAAETALVSCRPSRLKELAEAGQVGAQAALSLLSNSERLLSVVQVGVTICSLALGVAGEKAIEEQFLQLFGPLMNSAWMKTVLTAISVALAYLIMTYVHVVIGEVVPKNVGIDKRDRLAVIVAPALLVFFRVVEPFVFVLEKSASAISRMIGVRGMAHVGHSVEELKFILQASLRDGILEGFSEKAMQRLLDLQEYLTREIMVPRSQVVSASSDSSIENLLRVANESQYTRLPIYEGRPENLIGYVHVKDLLRVWEESRQAEGRRWPVRKFELRKMLRPLPVVPESKPVVQLLEEFRSSHSHLAVVVDEFGSTVGVVSLEDLVEQILGEIEDEHDARRPHLPVEAPVLHLDGAIPIRDLDSQYSIDLPADAGYETLAGFLLYRLGYIPTAGDSVAQAGRLFTVEEMERNRIAKVRIENLPATAVAEDAGIRQ
ncbi:MAG: HlyC/CorC family transporter [Candidatus Solibacter usitatus]|nr:HlyC/CorC family transporter [Candidatus Solibacter usitatus]